MGVRFEMDTSGFARIVLDRPERYNALDLTSMVRLQEATQAVVEDPNVRVLVVEGEGLAFSAGGDIDYFASRGPDADRMLEEIGRALNPVILNLRRMEAVVVMSVHGSVAGGSVGLMLAGDLVVAAAGTKFNLGYARMGGSPDAGVSWFLARFAGHLAAFELLALSETFDAERARELRLVNHVVPSDERMAFTARLVERLLAAPAISVRNMKRLVTRAHTSDLGSHLDAEIEAYALATRSPDFREGVAAFLEKRQPAFNRRS